MYFQYFLMIRVALESSDHVLSEEYMVYLCKKESYTCKLEQKKMQQQETRNPTLLCNRTFKAIIIPVPDLDIVLETSRFKHRERPGFLSRDIGMFLFMETGSPRNLYFFWRSQETSCQVTRTTCQVTEALPSYQQPCQVDRASCQVTKRAWLLEQHAKLLRHHVKLLAALPSPTVDQTWSHQKKYRFLFP